MRDADPAGNSVGALLKAPVKVDRSAPLPADRQAAATLYREYLQTAPAGGEREEALRRLADLGLELAADADASGEPAAGADSGAPLVPDEVIQLYERLLSEERSWTTTDTVEAQSRRPEQTSTAPEATAPGLVRVYRRAEDPGLGGSPRDQVLYQLARAYDYTGRRDEALTTLERLVEEHPGSPYYVEAQFRRGEAHFSAGEFGPAEAAYAAVLQRGEGDFHEHALYKRGWALFKQGRLEDSLDPFLLLYAAETAGGRVNPSYLPQARRERLADTMRAVSLVFSYQGGPPAMADYFAVHPGIEFQDRVYEALGQFYLEKERFSDAAATFGAFVDQNPGHDRAPLFLVSAVDAFERAGFPSEALDTKEALIRRYGLGTAFWQNRRREAHAEAVAAIEENLRELAGHYHAEAQADGDPATYDRAEGWYREYIASFPEGAGTPEMHFLLADLLLETGRPAQAATEYARTAYDYGAHPRAAEAGYAAVLALRRQADQVPERDAANWLRQATAAGLRFAEAFPGHAEAPAVLTRSAEDLFRQGEFARAADAAGQVLARYPEAPLALRRNALLTRAHARFDLGEHAAAEQDYDRLLSLTAPGDEAWPELRTRLAAAVYKQGEAHREAGELREAVTDFLRVGELVPEAASVPTARFDAAAALLQLEAWSEAIPILSALRTAHPDSDLQPEVTRRLANAYLKDGRELAAAAEFQRMGGDEYPAEWRREALLQAADLYLDNGRREAAAESFETFLERFPRPLEDASEVRWRLAGLHAETGDPAARLAVLEELVAAQESADPEARTERSRFLAAQASMELADSARADYDAVALTEPLRENLQRKKAHMEAALARYRQAAGYGVAGVTTAATFRLASVYFDFSRALLDSERPGDLSGEELEQYDILLEEQAFPFEEKAIEIHQVNAARTAGGVYDEWVQRSFDQLARLLPVRYAKTERTVDLVESLN
ncbi:MAG: tetratricopeptide repeat protein [Myxococcota bacterium]|nr:tetratricopeptide repeat protein [Myxococcota bacterium]